MERTKYIFLIFFCLLTLALSGQNKEHIYNAFINGNMEKWKKEIDKAEQKYQMSHDDRLEHINNQIGYIGWCISMKKYDEAKKYINLTNNHLETLENNNFKPSYVLSYKGAVNGLKIGLNHFSAIFLGPGIMSKAKQSIKLDSQNPNGYILLGNSKYYMWAMLGGSKKGAVEYYKKAEQILEKDHLTHQNWNYLSLLTMIAHAYVEMGNYNEANNYYKKILNIEPNYKWIKEEVYPQFLKKYKI